ncbi:hypothetical protein J437_LFUL003073 [Ladona fulva]|uniref:Uncharacterized protein n=1 Tax=Ladona fulva TaxID=123851 RepID=A0A8K0JYX6_LADFU|nr:hypothetical protein J437_LFUL003073 [Ladona fulva]
MWAYYNMFVNLAQTGFRATSRLIFKVENGKFNIFGELLNRKWFERAKRLTLHQDSSSFHSITDLLLLIYRTR